MMTSKLKLLIPISIFAVVIGCSAKKEASLVGEWRCASHVLEFSKDGIFQVTQTATGLKWTGIYGIVDSPQYWGELKAENAPHPIKEYRYLRAEPSVVPITSMSGLILFNSSGDVLPCQPAPRKS